MKQCNPQRERERISQTFYNPKNEVSKQYKLPKKHTKTNVRNGDL